MLVNVTTPDPVASPNQRQITSTGWTPTNPVADTRTKAHRRIQATVERFPPFAFNTPAPCAVKGDLGVGGNALVDVTTDLSCGKQRGSITAGRTDVSGSASVKGRRERDRQRAWHRLSTESDRSGPLQRHHARRGQLEDAARAREEERHLFRPRVSEWDRAGTPSTRAGSFSSSNKAKNGIVLLETVSGTDIPTLPSAQNASDFASLSINGNPFQSGAFSGWIVVNGSINISGNMADQRAGLRRQ